MGNGVLECLSIVPWKLDFVDDSLQELSRVNYLCQTNAHYQTIIALLSLLLCWGTVLVRVANMLNRYAWHKVQQPSQVCFVVAAITT